MKKSKNWNEALLEECYYIKVYQRKDTGFSILYSCMEDINEKRISERFEVGEEVIVREVKHEVIKTAYEFYNRDIPLYQNKFKEHIAILKKHLGALDFVGACVNDETKKQTSEHHE